MSSLRDIIKERGYVVLEGVFEEAEIDAIRDEIVNFAKTHKCMRNASGITIPDFLKRPKELGKTGAMIASGRWHDALRDIFGGDDYRFCEHNDIGINRIVGWHKDKLNGKFATYETVDIWSTTPDGKEHEIVKVLTYLEDHSKDSLALKIVPGSHLSRKIDPKGFVQLHPKKGDTVIFDQRITHRGMDRQVGYPRILTAFGFGRNNIFTDNFEKGTVARQTEQNRGYL